MMPLFFLIEPFLTLFRRAWESALHGYISPQLVTLISYRIVSTDNSDMEPRTAICAV